MKRLYFLKYSLTIYIFLFSLWRKVKICSSVLFQLTCCFICKMIFYQGSDPLLWDVRHVEEHGSTVGIRIQVSGSPGLQEVDPDEHAARQRGKGQLHDHAFLTNQVQISFLLKFFFVLFFNISYTYLAVYLCFTVVKVQQSITQMNSLGWN